MFFDLYQNSKQNPGKKGILFLPDTAVETARFIKGQDEDPDLPDESVFFVGNLSMKYRCLYLKYLIRTNQKGLFVRLLPAICLFFLISAFRNDIHSMNTPAGQAASADDPSDARVLFSHESGCFPEDLTVTLEAPAGYTVAYTLDGTIPTAADDSGASSLELPLHPEEPGYLLSHKKLMLYPEFSGSRMYASRELPIGIVLRASTVSPAGVCGIPETRVYFPGIDFTELYPDAIIISAVLDPDDLLNYESGILAAGRVYDEWKQTDAIKENKIWLIESNSTQMGRAWERPCLMQIYDGQNTVSAEINAGIRIMGSLSRRLTQKSFNFYFRKDYGENNLNYELIKGTKRYKSFSLKGGGNNTDQLKFKEAFMQDLLSDRDAVSVRSRPAVLFLNGEYWGPYTLSEKLSDLMIADRFGVDREQVIIVKESAELEAGDDEDLRLYDELMAYADKDLSDPEVYRQFCEVMDIRSMADYCAAQIYIANADWTPVKNDVLWRTRDTSYNNGRWQYILHDIEQSTGMYGLYETSPETDHIQIAMENYPLFAAAMKNREFAGLFFSSLQEIGSVNFNPERVNSELQKYLKIWLPLLPDFYLRYGNKSWEWDNSLRDMIRFFEKRYPLIMQFAENAVPKP